MSALEPKNFLRWFPGSSCVQFKLTDEYASFQTAIQCTCGEQTDEDGFCKHVADCIYAISPHSDPVEPERYLVTRLSQFMQRSLSIDCLALLDLWAFTLGVVAAKCEDTIAAGQFEVHPSTLEQREVDDGQHNKKRKRHDEDWAKCMINETVADNNAKSGATALRCSGVASSKSAPSWERRELCAGQACLWRNAQSIKHLATQADGARLGDPAEENHGQLGWSPQIDLGIYLPFMAYPACLHKRFYLGVGSPWGTYLSLCWGLVAGGGWMSR